jgi:hypothetical protein
MNIKHSLGGPLGLLIEGTLKETKKGEFELLVSYRGEIGRVYYFENDQSVHYGIFMPHFQKLNSQMRFGQDGIIRNYVKESKKKA